MGPWNIKQVHLAGPATAPVFTTTYNHAKANKMYKVLLPYHGKLCSDIWADCQQSTREDISPK